MAKVYATPGVYIEEKSAFPNSAVPVATAVPAFIGYTEKAILGKKDITHMPTKISSFGEYLLYFGGAPKTTFTFTNIRKEDPNLIYKLEPKPETRFLLFYSMKLFFANGGSDCYVVSIGRYQDAKNAPTEKAYDHFDSEATDEATQEIKLLGLRALLKEPEPTMIVIPDAVLLSGEQCKDLQVSVLKHCGEIMRSRVAILDVYDGFKKRSKDPKQDVVNIFRDNIGTNNLQWGAAYYPWVATSITGSEAVNYTNIDAGTLDALISTIGEEVDEVVKDGVLDAKRAEAIKAEAARMKTVTTPEDIKTVHQTLLVISPLYKSILESLREQLNLLPPSAGLAGIYSMVDNSIGVFQSPANVSIGSVVKPSVNLTNDEQEDLNVPLNGKAINAIRTFPGKGILIWGARTLDGNSQDWRYISVRRTVIFIEQSIKYAAEPYVFAPNTSATWTNLKALLINFLTNVWQQGALAGATAEDAFEVYIGLGSTMTPVDILDGIMKIQVKIAVTRPAEFIVIEFQQKMQQS